MHKQLLVWSDARARTRKYDHMWYTLLAICAVTVGDPTHCLTQHPPTTNVVDEHVSAVVKFLSIGHFFHTCVRYIDALLPSVVVYCSRVTISLVTTCPFPEGEPIVCAMLELAQPSSVKSSQLDYEVVLRICAVLAFGAKFSPARRQIALISSYASIQGELSGRGQRLGGEPRESSGRELLQRRVQRDGPASSFQHQTRNIKRWVMRVRVCVVQRCFVCVHYALTSGALCSSCWYPWTIWGCAQRQGSSCRCQCVDARDQTRSGDSG